jgi:hypothetical protein
MPSYYCFSSSCPRKVWVATSVGMSSLVYTVLGALKPVITNKYYPETSATSLIAVPLSIPSLVDMKLMVTYMGSTKVSAHCVPMTCRLRLQSGCPRLFTPSLAALKPVLTNKYNPEASATSLIAVLPCLYLPSSILS